jgi:hypothetical protein
VEYYGCDKPDGSETCPGYRQGEIRDPITGKCRQKDIPKRCPDGTDPHPIWGCNNPSLCPKGTTENVYLKALGLEWPLYCVPNIVKPDVTFYYCDDGSKSTDHKDDTCPEDIPDRPRCSDGSFPEDYPDGKCPPGVTKCPDGYRYDTTLENLPGVNPCVPDDGCPDGQQRSPNDNKCYKRGEGPEATDRFKQCGSGAMVYKDDPCPEDVDPEYAARLDCDRSGGTYDGYLQICVPPGMCLGSFGELYPEGPNGCGYSYDNDPYAYRWGQYAAGGSVESTAEFSSPSDSMMGKFKMFGIPEMPKGLGSEDIRMMEIDPRYMASGDTVKRTKKYQTGGIASLPARDPRLGGAVNPAEGYNFGFAQGGMSSMPEYQAGGKLLRGPGDGMSDDIPAVIRGKGVQRAALADGEFVIPADVVSHLGNGSTEAGAKKLYKMMEQIRRARTGTGKQAPQVNTDKYLPRMTPAKKRRRG